MRVPLFVIMLAALAAAQPLPENFVLDTSAVWWSVDSVEESPAVATCGSSFLVVWQTRTGTDRDIRAARVGHSGEVLDLNGFVVTACSLDQLAPQVAEGAAVCFVVWEDRRGGSRWDIYGARVNPAGSVLDPGGLLIRTGSGDSRSPAIAFGHGRWLVAWEDRTSNGDISCAVIDSSGAAGVAVPVCRAAGAQSWPAVGATDSGFVVAWEDWRNGQYPQVMCARVTPGGTVLDTAGIALRPDRYDQERPAVARCGGNALIAWEESALLDADIWGVRLSPGGSVLDSIPIRIARAPGPQRRPRLAARDDDVEATWVDMRSPTTLPDIYAARISADGTVTDSAGRPVAAVPGPQDQPCVAWGDTLGLVAWRDAAGDTLYRDLCAARLSAEDSVLDPGGFSVIDLRVPLYFAQQDPAVAFGGGCYLALWAVSQTPVADHNILGLRLSRTGAVLDPAPLVICAAQGTQQLPRVAFNGSCFLVLWSDSRSNSRALYGTRVDTLGRVMDTVNLVLSSASCYEVAVCSDGERWLVTWRVTVGSQLDILGTFVESDGAVTHPGGFHVTSTSQADYCPAVSFGDEQYFIAWNAGRTLYSSEILGNRFARDGALLDTARFFSNLPGSDAKAAISFDGDNFLTSWVYHQGALYAICGLRVDTAGVALDSPAVYVYQSTNYCDDVEVVFNGAYHYLVWAEQMTPVWLVMGARVGRSAAVFETFPLVVDERARPIPALAGDTEGGMLTVYPGRVDSLNGRPVGLDRIKGVLSPYGGVAEGSSARGRQPLLRASPVPFRGEVRLEAGRKGDIAVVRDAVGREVRTLAFGATGAAAWDGADATGRQLPRGVYFAALQSSPGGPPCKLVKLE